MAAQARGLGGKGRREDRREEELSISKEERREPVGKVCYLNPTDVKKFASGHNWRL